MKTNAKLKLGLIFILVGLFLPNILLPFTSDYRPGGGLLQNIKEMKLVLWRERIPSFEPVAKKRSMLSEIFEKYTYEEVPVKVGDVTYTFEFPENMSGSERKKVLDRKLEGAESDVIGALNAELAGKERLRFRWQVRPVALQYRYPLVGGMVLIFLGAVFLVLSIQSSSK